MNEAKVKIIRDALLKAKEVLDNICDHGCPNIWDEDGCDACTGACDCQADIKKALEILENENQTEA